MLAARKPVLPVKAEAIAFAAIDIVAAGFPRLELVHANKFQELQCRTDTVKHGQFPDACMQPSLVNAQREATAPRGLADIVNTHPMIIGASRSNGQIQPCRDISHR